MTESDKNVALSKYPDFDIEVPRLNGKLYGFQKSSVAYSIKNERVIVGEPTGTGKTVIACGVVAATNRLPVVIVAPKTLVPVWEREIEHWCNNISSVQVIDSADDRVNHSDVTIVNYGMVSYDVSENSNRLVKQLCGLSPQTFIADEAHALRGESLRSYGAEQIANYSQYRLLLTATPIVKNRKDIPRLLEILDQDIKIPESRDAINRHLRGKCYTRHKRNVVLKDLPSRVRRSVKVEISNRYEYEALKEKYIHSLSKKTGFKALYEFRKTAALGKIDYIEKLTNYLEGSTVLFAIHRKVQRELLRRFPHAPRVVASQSTNRRKSMVERFQRGGYDKIIVAIGSTPEQSPGGVGIELTNANHGIFCELGWTHSHMLQASNRIHRMGQKNPVQIWYPIAEDTIDEEIWDLIEKRKESTEEITIGQSLRKIKNKYAR